MVEMKKHFVFFILILLFILNGCSDPPNKEEIDQFYKDSAFVYDLLRKAHDQGRTELKTEEQREITTYEAYYDSESDFYKGAETNLQLISSGILLMESYLTSTSTSVGDDEKEFQKHSEEVQQLLLKKYEN
jgi:hypothetical protein